MDQVQAEVLYQIFIGTLIPVVVSNVKQAHWPNHQKFGLVFLISLVAAAIVPIAQFTSNESFDYGKFAAMLGTIFTTSQIVYQGAFKYLDMESTVNPKAALLSLIKEQVSLYIESIPNEKVRIILDPESESSIEVVINESNSSEE
jgi:cytochrome c biogenesis factor